MDISDLHNLTILARKGISVLAEQMPADHAQAAWKAIGNAETELNNFKQAQEKQSIDVEEVTSQEKTEEVTEG